jgi:uncharacterized protein (DUF983 family)
MGSVSKLPRQTESASPARRQTRQPSRFTAIRRGSSPRCGDGAIFAGRFQMNEQCPVCGMSFNREPGYFAGAMYISYGLALPIVFLWVMSLGAIFDTWSLERVVLASFVLFLPFVPAVFRYSRILWIHFDRSVDPTDD